MTGLYIHIPFCVKKCKYCDFISFDNRCDAMSEYVSLLVREMGEYRGEDIDTVFIGGGTPTALGTSLLSKLFDGIAENFNLAKDAEFTVEANPKTLTKEKLSLFKKYGVSRISVGVQSFNDDELKKIGRIHTGREAEETLELIKASDFENFSLDLMSALPGQTMESFKKTLRKAVDINPAHISCYSLILEEGTPLFGEYEKGNLILPDEETEREMYNYACDFLEEHGYKQYEISNFAKPGYESKHNIKYWHCDEYIGTGLSAHSFYKGERYSNTSCLEEYMRGEFHTKERSILTLSDKIEEFSVMSLRMRSGINKAEFLRRFGLELEEVYKAELERFIKTGFLADDGENVFLTREGISVSNSIMCEFSICNLKNNG